MELQENLIRLRHRRHLSQEQLAEQLGVARQTVSRWEVGTVIPTADNLLALGTLYGVSVEELMDGDVEDILHGPAVHAPKEGYPECAAAEEAVKASVPVSEETPSEPEKEHKSKGRSLAAAISIVTTFLLIFLWGELTNSRTSAAYLLELLGTCILTGAVVYGLYKLLYSLFKALRRRSS